jgi:hypothetical protein
MPKVTDNIVPEAEAMQAAWTQFEAGFKRSKKGNLWRHYDGQTACVFSRDDGYFGWSISGNDSQRFSRGGYQTEEEALGALGETLGIGY